MGSKDPGHWDGMSYHVDLVRLPALVVVTVQCQHGHPNPSLCLLPLNTPSFPVLWVTSGCNLLCWIAWSGPAANKGVSLKNNQTLPGVGCL